MAVETLVPVSEYLATSYEVDPDYVDGELIERNLGEGKHSGLTMRLANWFYLRREQLQLEPFPEIRLRVLEQRYRVADLALAKGLGERQDVITERLAAAIEILSPDDSMRRMMPRIEDLLRVSDVVWAIEPYSGDAWVADLDGLRKVTDGHLRLPKYGVHLPLADVVRPAKKREE